MSRRYTDDRGGLSAYTLAHDLLDLYAWGTSMALACTFMVLSWVFAADVADQARMGLCPDSMATALGICATGFTMFMVLTFVFGTISQGEGHMRRSLFCGLSMWWIMEFVMVILLVTTPGFVLLGTTEHNYSNDQISIDNSTIAHTNAPTTLAATIVPSSAAKADDIIIPNPIEQCSKAGSRMVYVSAIVLPLFIWVIAVVAQSTRFGCCVNARYTRASTTEHEITEFTNISPPIQPTFSITGEDDDDIACDSDSGEQELAKTDEIP